MDLGSEIRDPEKTYSGSRIQGSKRPRIRIHNTVINNLNYLMLSKWYCSTQYGTV
jgi:hypothetical protein